MSHPQALSQCDGYIRQMRGVAREAVLDTAGAAQDIARHEWRCVPRAFPAHRACYSVLGIWPNSKRLPRAPPA